MMRAGTMEVSLNVNNALGYAEQIAASVEYGLQRSNVCSLSLTKPRPWGRPLIGELRFHQLSNNFEKWSSFTELLRGGVATLTRSGRCQPAALAAAAALLRSPPNLQS
jgi:outer membrane protein insertion porin family